MSVKVKGGMYCNRCKQPVMAQRSGHAVRNAVAVGGSLATLGLSLLATKKEKWCCPVCGGSVVTMGAASRPRRRGKPQWRCEKNGHLLDRKKHTTCPIDGSSGVWRTP